jgi:CRP-like cAMP-binding protein
MPVPKEIRLPVGNRLLNALPPAEYEALGPHLERVHLPLHTMLYQAGDRLQYAYFPLNGMTSLLSITKDGDAIEVAMVGDEGMVDVACILRVNITPYQSVVQIPADALRIRADLLRKEFDKCGRLKDVLLRYTYALLTHVSQSAVCNRYHNMDSRLCGRLLVARDRVKSDTFNLTQESIAQMLGAPRTGVTASARRLQDKGLIQYRRGKITILNRQELEEISCECYGIVRQKIDQFLVA